MRDIEPVEMEVLRGDLLSDDDYARSHRSCKES